ncbi:microsomal triacylglycerol transfer protein isoform X1 [Megalopta genalis]|uniref:microsomal triacylglycerol transfer protein isoform X1 n=1 Tax=Megalopta genalis TaxID=115081 RepID=UPI001442F4B1|nr:microsomal triglyceride transfer protein large subunit isoform X1 [Megalopta genalis]XP_033328371.1 microsomal triglyceride transfer protein large subunit isoform X1 [Megalopta genalis]
MVCPERPVTALTVSLVYLLALFGSYCQMAPAAMAGAARAWDVVSGLKYKLTTTLLFNEAAPPKTSGDVGLRLTGELNVTAVWQQPTDHDTFLLRIQLLSPQLWIKSRRAPEPEGFVEHSSKVDTVGDKPVLLLWRHGEIKSIYMDPSETVSSANLKRGLASFFQYRLLDGEVQERDASGLCNATYHSLGPKSIMKEKTFCEHATLPSRKRHPNPLFDVKVVSEHKTNYELSHYLLPSMVHVKESHKMTLPARPEVGTIVTSEGILEEVTDLLTPNRIQANTVREAIVWLQPGFVETSIELQLEPATCPSGGCQTLEQALDEHRNALENAALGTGKSAAAFNKLLPLVKSATSEELLKILKSPRYRLLKTQLLDVIGSVSTMPGHQAAMKALRQDEIGDDTERYLWALSLSPSPDADVAKDVLRRSEETMQNDKVSETLALTAAAMARHLGSPSAVEKARVSLEIGLESCTGEECKLKFLRALRNLRSKASIPTLLRFATGDDRAISVAAWRALSALPKGSITDEAKVAARRVFYQIGGPRRDSSARTIALDVILENSPSKDDVRGLVEYLAGSDTAYEIRKYLGQRLEQVSKKDARLAANLNEIMEEYGKSVVNYNVLAQRGLSTAFTRHFLTSADSNGSLVTIQEISSGILKRGTVDVVLEVDGHNEALFSLGLFAGGLGGFVSTSGQEDAQDDEPATAGMEVDFMGVGIRPFTFFSGQGELMGHVWSGTASERTPAFQALSSVHSYSEHIPLTSGMVAEIDVQGAVSFDLAGQIQLSLWSRNAQSLVDLKAGVVIQGGSKVRTDFVQSMAEFAMTMEPKLELATDVDFSGPVSLCMRLSQPTNLVKYQVYKVERIAGSRHKLRKTRRMKLHSPGRSYQLNSKNNEMCSKVINSQ